VENCLSGGNMIEELGLHPETAAYRGLELLNVNLFILSSIY